MLFGKKKEAVNKELQEIKEAVDEPLPTREDLGNIELKKDIPAEEHEAGQKVLTGIEEQKLQPQPKPVPAPIFIKLDRYKNILGSLTEIRKGLEAIRNIFSYVSELEKMKSESFKMLHDMMAKIDKKLAHLDSEFLKPPGFESEVSPEVAFEPSNLEGIIDNMRNKIDDLRSQIDNI